MKKVVFLFYLVFLPFEVKAISASSAIAMDLNSNRIFYEANIHDERLIASITKIMTCIVTIENANINQKVTVGDEVLKAYGSAIYIEVGEELTLKDLLYGLMLRSGNDAAVVIAKNVAGSMEKFATLMNELAKKIGMNNTYFYNAHGLEEQSGKGNTSTAYDMALLTKYAYQNATFREIFGTKNIKIKSSTKTYSWTSKNKLIHRYDFVTGGKTGFTEKARRTLVTTASKNNLDVVVVTLNDPNDFQDHITLYNKVFEEYTPFLVLSKNNFKIKEDTYYEKYKLYITNDIFIPIKTGEKDYLKINYRLTKVKKPLNGDKVGEVEIYLKDKLIRKDNIYIEIEEKHQKLNWFQKIIRWFKSW